MEVDAKNNKRFVLGIDIGGTKIDAQLFEVKGSVIAETPTQSFKQDTQRGVENHRNQIASIIAEATQAVEGKGGTLAGVGIGSPGRFTAGGRIKPGTNQNLGNTPEEFDGITLVDEYRKAFAALAPELVPIPLHVLNDGNAMLAGMLEAINKGKVQGLTDQDGKEVTALSLRRKSVALFGIGTGVGHAVAEVNDKGGFDFVTDGHASKLRVQVDEEDLPLLRTAKQRLEAKTGKEEVMMFNDNTVRAEDLFRGPVINALAGVEDGHAIDPANPDHKAALRFAGKYMSRLAVLIKGGRSIDVEPANGWSAEDRYVASQTNMYLVGGGMGSSLLGKEIIKYANQEGALDLQFVQMTGENVAARAAATLVPESVYRGSPTVSV